MRVGMRVKTWIGTKTSLALRLRGGALLLAAGIALASPATIARAETLTVATTEYTGDWNPISHQSYPAQLVARFTTERLFEKRCVGGRDQTEPEFVNICQSGTGYDPSGSIRLILDPQRCVGLDRQDVAFTVGQIRRQPYNDYFAHELTLDDDRLSVGKPKAPAEWVAKEAFSFPLLRRPQEDADGFYAGPISVGGHPRYNAATGGLYMIDEITEQSLRLVRRTPPAAGGIDDIEFVYYLRFLNMQETMPGEHPPDLVLSWPITKPYRDTAYRARKPENLGSFTFVGFNFRSHDEPQRDLIHSQRFRELFTKSLWLLSPVEANVDFGGQGVGSARGIFLGESFDTGSLDAVDRPPRERIAAAIGGFIADQNLEGVQELTVLISPVFEKLFDRTDRANIATELNELWRAEEKAGIRFELIDPALGPAGFEREKRAGRYHLVFDTFIYGRNHLRYMAFLQPGNALNFLGVDVPSLSGRKISVWMEEGPRGIKAFLDVVAREYPVAVMAHFPRRDLFHQALKTPEDCPAGAVAMPYQGIERWQKQPAERAPR